MTTWKLLWTGWDWHVSIVVGCVGLAGVYLWAVNFRRDRKTAWFLSGCVVLLLTLVGPLDFLGDDYMFSAHMMEHLFLMLVVAPMLLLGIPEDLAGRLLSVRAIDGTERFLGLPAVSWFVGVFTLWVWHWPPMYNAALASENVHAVEHLTMLVAATIFWWPVLAPPFRRRLQPFAAMLYLYVGALANTLLGVLITFAPLGAYPKYIHLEGDMAIVKLIRNGWGIDAKADLQLGGLFMWVFGGFVFLWAVLAMYARWYRMPDPDSTPS